MWRRTRRHVEGCGRIRIKVIDFLWVLYWIFIWKSWMTMLTCQLPHIICCPSWILPCWHIPKYQVEVIYVKANTPTCWRLREDKNKGNRFAMRLKLGESYWIFIWMICIYYCAMRWLVSLTILIMNAYVKSSFRSLFSYTLMWYIP